MGRSALTLSIGMVALLAAGSALAGGDVDVELHASKRLMINGSAANVIIGDSKIADVTLVDSHSVVLTGHHYGRTNVIVLDSKGRALLDAHISVTPPEEARVTVYRGDANTELTCTPHCRRPASEGDNAGLGGDGDSGDSNPNVTTTLTKTITATVPPAS